MNKKIVPSKQMKIYFFPKMITHSRTITEFIPLLNVLLSVNYHIFHHNLFCQENKENLFGVKKTTFNFGTGQFDLAVFGQFITDSCRIKEENNKK